MENVICYEQPLNERTRTLLRLEFLFQQISHAASGESDWDSRYALQGLLEILILTSRNEIKSELRKELERHTESLNRLRIKHAANVDTSTLEIILENIKKAMDGINKLNNFLLDDVRKNDFLSAIRQRSSIPGGTCLFDLPSLHHWLQKDTKTRTQHLANWLRPLLPIRDAAQLILRLIRNSSTATWETAAGGFFQRSLDGNSPSQLVRVLLPADADVFPEISGGRHRFSIRFMVQSNPNEKSIQSTDDVGFHLVCCVI